MCLHIVSNCSHSRSVITCVSLQLIEGCQLLNKCLTQLARQFPTVRPLSTTSEMVTTTTMCVSVQSIVFQVKFCRVQSYQLNDHLSAEFVSEATLCTCTGIAQANSAYAVKRAHIYIALQPHHNQQPTCTCTCTCICSVGSSSNFLTTIILFKKSCRLIAIGCGVLYV